MDRAADWGPYDLSSIPLGEKKENKGKAALYTTIVNVTLKMR